jgi:hypothetical protein
MASGVTSSEPRSMRSWYGSTLVTAAEPPGFGGAQGG